LIGSSKGTPTEKPCASSTVRTHGFNQNDTKSAGIFRWVMVRKTTMSHAPAPETVVPDLPDALAVLPICRSTETPISVNYDFTSRAEAHRWETITVGGEGSTRWTALLSKRPNTCWHPLCRNTAKVTLNTFARP